MSKIGICIKCTLVPKQPLADEQAVQGSISRGAHRKYLTAFDFESRPFHTMSIV
jgi:hypothetical protein